MVEYDKRKVIKVGERSYAITIPKKWSKELGMKPGDVVDLIYDGQSIIIKPLIKTSSFDIPGRIILDIRKSKDHLMREIIACYIEGLNKVRVKGEVRELNKLVNYLQKKLVGLVAISKIGSDYLDIVFVESYLNLDEITKRATSIVKDMMEFMLEYFDTLNEVYLDDIMAYDDEVDRMYFLGLRLVRGKLIRIQRIEEIFEAIDTVLFLKNIEHIGDSLDSIANVLKNNKGIIIEKDLHDLFIKVKKFSLDALFAYTNNEINAALNVLASKQSMRELIEKGELRSDLGKLLLKEFDTIIRSSSDIAEIVVSKCIRDKACSCTYFYPNYAKSK